MKSFSAQCEAAPKPRSTRQVPLSPRCQRRTNDPSGLCAQHRNGNPDIFDRWPDLSDPGRYHRR